MFLEVKSREGIHRKYDPKRHDRSLEQSPEDKKNLTSIDVGGLIDAEVVLSLRSWAWYL